jgi:hypothetical protein
MNNNILKYKGWQYFLILTGMGIIIEIAINYLFLSEGLYYQSFGERIAADRIAKMIELSQKWQWLGYVFVPIAILIRVSFTSVCLYIGYFLANVKSRFKDLFKASLLADFVFVLTGLTKLFVLIFIKEVSTLDDLQFQPLSLLELLNKKSIDVVFIYPLSLINVFEFSYWIILAWLLSRIIEKPYANSLKTVVSCYGSGLFLWVVFVMFLTINMT